MTRNPFLVAGFVVSGHPNWLNWLARIGEDRQIVARKRAQAIAQACFMTAEKNGRVDVATSFPAFCEEPVNEKDGLSDSLGVWQVAPLE